MKKKLFKFHLVTQFSAEIVEICGRDESKLLLEGAILAARFEPTYIKKNSLDLSAIIFLVSNRCFIYS